MSRTANLGEAIFVITGDWQRLREQVEAARRYLQEQIGNFSVNIGGGGGTGGGGGSGGGHAGPTGAPSARNAMPTPQGPFGGGGGFTGPIAPRGFVPGPTNPPINWLGFGAGGGAPPGMAMPPVAAPPAAQPAPAAGGGRGGNRFHGPGMMLYYNTVFGLWEASQMQTSLSRSNIQSALALDPTDRLSAQIQGVRGATSGPIGGAFGSVLNFLGTSNSPAALEEGLLKLTAIEEDRKATREHIRNIGWTDARMAAGVGTFESRVEKAKQAIERRHAPMIELEQQLIGAANKGSLVKSRGQWVSNYSGSSGIWGGSGGYWEEKTDFVYDLSADLRSSHLARAAKSAADRAKDMDEWSLEKAEMRRSEMVRFRTSMHRYAGEEEAADYERAGLGFEARRSRLFTRHRLEEFAMEGPEFTNDERRAAANARGAEFEAFNANAQRATAWRIQDIVAGATASGLRSAGQPYAAGRAQAQQHYEVQMRTLGEMPSWMRVAGGMAFAMERAAGIGEVDRQETNARLDLQGQARVAQIRARGTFLDDTSREAAVVDLVENMTSAGRKNHELWPSIRDLGIAQLGAMKKGFERELYGSATAEQIDPRHTAFGEQNGAAEIVKGIQEAIAKIDELIGEVRRINWGAD